jgi:hypothetical protein
MKLCVYGCPAVPGSQRLISYIKMKVCMYVCVYVRRPAAGPTQPITPKFGMGSSFHPGSAPSQGATRNVDPRPRPQPRPQPRPLLLLSSLDHSARDYFTISL